MKCIFCEKEARAICRFCGRALCEEHLKTRPFVQTVYVGAEDTPKVVAIKSAVYCGTCEPTPMPIELPEIY